MPADLDLFVEADDPSRCVDFRLLDEHGSHVASRHADLNAIPASRQQGLFDLPNFVRHYFEPAKQPTIVAEIGVCIADDLLGDEIFQILWKPVTQRTLRIHLPPAHVQTHLAAALGRVPWEIARPAADRATLDERFLFIRIVQQTESASEPLHLRAAEAVKVLFVFAEARGSRPLAARRELREIRRLMEREVYPTRRVVAHVLSHGVTRERLRAQIQENSGYHIVHWSGHGHLNALELANAGNLKDNLTGQGLLDLFIEAGGFVPRLVFLSACHSGDVLRIRDWNGFIAAAREDEPGARVDGLPPADDPLQKDSSGYTGIAHALLAGSYG